MAPKSTPPWLYLLNALQKDWRTGELLKDRDPDAYLEQQLRRNGAWPPKLDRLAARPEVERRTH